MDLFGKILVLVNFAISLMMAAIGGAVLYYRVDWSDNAGDPATGVPPGANTCAFTARPLVSPPAPPTP